MSGTSPKRDNHTPSCAVCKRRKVKCNRVYPCAACVKSRLDCVFTITQRQPKRTRRNTELEEDQRSFDPSRDFEPRHQSVTGSQESNTPAPKGSGRNGHAPRLVSDGDGLRYLNNHLWSAISSEKDTESRDPTTFRTGRDPYNDNASRGGEGHTSGLSFLFRQKPTSPQPPYVAPVLLATQTTFLWQTYLTNIDPVLKCSHAPTLQPMMLSLEEGSGLDRAEQALKAAVFFLSVVSLTEQECLDNLQEGRETLLRRHKDAAERALSAANFVTSTDIVTFLGLNHYLCALRSLGDVQTAFALLGLAIRIAGTMGLSRDGASLSLAPFEVEMRRRLWASLVYADGRMAEILGQDDDIMSSNFEAGAPSNLNDDELYPTMESIPNWRIGATDAIYVVARSMCTNASRRLQTIASNTGTWKKIQDSSRTLEERISIMNDIEREFREDIIERCSPRVPIQWLGMHCVKTFALKLRLLSKTPKSDVDKPWETEDGVSDNAFSLSLDLMQLQLDLWLEPSMQRWRWHWQSYFQWYGLACLLRQTRLRKSGPGVARAWTLIQKIFGIIIPTLELVPKKNPLLEGIHALLNAAKRQQDQPERDETIPVQFGATRNPLADRIHRCCLPHGSAPHNALFPTVETAPSADDQVSDPEYYQSPPFVIDFEAIDWAEFDRIAAELIR